MMIVDELGGCVHLNDVAGLSDISNLNTAFELVDHRDQVLGHLHVHMT